MFDYESELLAENRISKAALAQYYSTATNEAKTHEHVSGSFNSSLNSLFGHSSGTGSSVCRSALSRSYLQVRETFVVMSEHFK